MSTDPHTPPPIAPGPKATPSSTSVRPSYERAEPERSLDEQAKAAVLSLDGILQQDDARERAHRQGLPRSGLGYALRRVAGADEELISRFPADRHRYTAMGGVIVGTASIAALSMWFAVHNALRESVLTAAVAAILWAIFIVNIDRWMTSSVGAEGRTAKVRYLARFAMALVFAFVIAEPFVLRLFQTGIETEIQRERDHVVTTFRECNPENAGAPRAGLDCSAYRLNVSAGDLRMQELAQLAAQIDRDAKAVEHDQTRLDKQLQTTQAECAGVKQNDTTGKAGVGPLCQQNRGELRRLQATLNLQARRGELQKLRARHAELVAAVGDAGTAYAASVRASVDAAVHARFPQEPGLLERFAALGRLANSPTDGTTIRVAEWSLRLLFVTVECLPIIVKLVSGTGAYERAMRERMAVAGRVDTERAGAIESLDTLAAKVNQLRYAASYDQAAGLLKIEEKRRAGARHDDVNEEIERYRDRLLARGDFARPHSDNSAPADADPHEPPFGPPPGPDCPYEAQEIDANPPPRGTIADIHSEPRRTAATRHSRAHFAAFERREHSEYEDPVGPCEPDWRQEATSS